MEFSDIDEWKELATCLTRHSWPSCPAVCDEREGWTYSRILKAFDVPSSMVVRGHSGWLVFPTRISLVNFVRNSQLLLF